MADSENEVIESRYQVHLVEKTEAPEGMESGEWHRYVIGYGKSRIEGKKPGTLKEVRAHANSMVEDLNSRSVNQYSVYASRKKK